MKNILIICLLLSVAQCLCAQTTLPGLDPSFGNHGIVLDSFFNSNTNSKYANDVLIQPDGKIVAAGSVLCRYLPSGQPDSTFAGTGTIDLSVIVPDPDYTIAQTVHLQSDGKLIIAGYTLRNGFLIRFKSNGQIDSTYGANGITETYFHGLNCSTLQPDGKLIIAGITGSDYVLIRRFNTNGQPDSSFGANGFVLTYNGKYGGNIGGIGLMSDGCIVIGGIGYNAQDRRAAMAMRFLPNGSLDTTLNHTGIYYPFLVDYCWDMILQPDGKMLLALGGIGGGDGAITRLNMNGSIDSTYGQSGFATVPSMRIETMMLMPDNKLLCGGDDGDFVVARVMPEGVSMDTVFGVNGIIRTDMSGFTDDIIHGIALQQDGKIIAAGRSVINNNRAPTRLTLARYLSNAQTGINSLHQTQSQFAIRIAPNPTTGFVHVDYNAAPGSSGGYKILSLEGRVLLTGSVHGNNMILDVSTLVPGTYLLSVSAPSFSQAKLFTKQ